MVFAPSSLILTNYYLPLSEALYFSGDLVQNLNLRSYESTLKQVFSSHDKKDFTINCVLEGTMCDVISDCQISPSIFLIKNGPFHILGGDSNHSKAKEILDILPCGSTILPSPSEWILKLEQQPNIILHKYDRYSLDHKNISIDYLNEIITSTPNELSFKKIDAALAHEIYHNEDFQYHLQNFSSESDFLERGLGFVAISDGLIIGVASSALVCDSGYEINIMVLPKFRGNSIGKLLAAYLVKLILSRNKIPHWDAANEISLNLAKQLGYNFIDKYQAYRVTKI